MKQIFCSECGNSIEVDDTKSFCFCTQCGTRIEILNQTNTSDTQPIHSETSDDARGDSFIDEKLKEVEFYYKLSYDKKEYADLNSQPTYYVKAQDTLVDLSEEYEDDYRVWWNLAKPVDYMCTEFVPACKNYEINEMYFQKALDAAKIADKMEIVKAHDEYVERKKPYLEQEKLEREKKEQAERERLAREKEEQERKRQLKRKQEQIKAEEAKRKLEEQQHDIVPMNNTLWAEISGKKYDKINCSHCSYKDEKGDEVILAIRNISNMLHLLAYKKSAQNHMLYNMQTVTVKVDGKGDIIGFDGSPIVLLSQGRVMNICYDNSGNLSMNGMELTTDADYIDKLFKMAKKPLIKSKIFR